MRALFYSWEEFNYLDAVDTLLELGIEVHILAANYKRVEEEIKKTLAYRNFTDIKKIFVPIDGKLWVDKGKRPDQNPEFETIVFNELVKKEGGSNFYDLVFSFNYFPVISSVCSKLKIPYICHVYDSPFYPMASVEVDNECNHIYTFDKKQAEAAREKGVKTISYAPLGVNVKRITGKIDIAKKPEYKHEVSFLGQLYRGEYDFYDQMYSAIPKGNAGYFDGVISAQEQLFGHDLIGDEDVIPYEVISSSLKRINFELSGSYKLDTYELIRDFIRRKVSKNERWKLMEKVAARFDLDLYTYAYAEIPAGARNMGYADYMEEVPDIFNSSKINLNITLRTIISGIPLRVTDVLSCGGFLITTYQEQAAAEFEDGKHLVMAYTPEDLIEKISYFLKDDEKREKIALAGYKKIISERDYTKILGKMISESI